MSSANRVLLVLFQFGFLLFLFLLWLLWPKLPKLCWIVVVKVGTLVLFLTLGEMLSLSPLRKMFAVGLSYIAFIMLRYVPSIPAFWSFYHKWMLNFVKVFLCIYWGNHMLLSFNLLMWCITLINLWILKNLCILGIKPTWSWCMIFLMCCWILIARILLRIFASMFISDIGL